VPECYFPNLRIIFTCFLLNFLFYDIGRPWPVTKGHKESICIAVSLFTVDEKRASAWLSGASSQRHFCLVPRHRQEHRKSTCAATLVVTAHVTSGAEQTWLTKSVKCLAVDATLVDATRSIHVRGSTFDLRRRLASFDLSIVITLRCAAVMTTDHFTDSLACQSCVIVYWAAWFTEAYAPSS